MPAQAADALFDYELPRERIAQEPAPRRASSRLLVVNRAGGELEDDRFSGLPRHLKAGDLLVLNETRVLPVRVPARKPTGGKIELLFYRWESGGWRALARGGVRPGMSLLVEGWSEPLRVTGVDEVGAMIDPPTDDAALFFRRTGMPPLPPYIRRGWSSRADVAGRDRARYQTVYAREDGSVAAPTAGLHFTPGLLRRIAAHGVGLARVTLHVGLGTFKPVAGDWRDHVMHAEYGVIPEAAAEAINRTRREGGRIIAVGTTTARLLEWRATERGSVRAGEGMADLFITPGHRFRAIDALVTNFHLPRSTLLLLVSAFAGGELARRAYGHAVEAGYRFYSYGDAMLIA